MKEATQMVSLGAIDDILGETTITPTIKNQIVNLDVEYTTLGNIYYLIGPAGTPLIDSIDILHAI
jgi:hypothetical protein